MHIAHPCDGCLPKIREGRVKSCQPAVNTHARFPDFTVLSCTTAGVVTQDSTKTTRVYGCFFGATAGDRTQDLGLKRPLLYQLSYRRKSSTE
jgi:hypothetical protein